MSWERQENGTKLGSDRSPFGGRFRRGKCPTCVTSLCIIASQAYLSRERLQNLREPIGDGERLLVPAGHCVAAFFGGPIQDGPLARSFASTRKVVQWTLVRVIRRPKPLRLTHANAAGQTLQMRLAADTRKCLAVWRTRSRSWGDAISGKKRRIKLRAEKSLHSTRHRGGHVDVVCLLTRARLLSPGGAAPCRDPLGGSMRG